MTKTQTLTNKILAHPTIAAITSKAPKVIIPKTREELIELALGGDGDSHFKVTYNVPGRGHILEAEVVRCRNGVAVNYMEEYMRRRDPDSMVIADDLPTDKTRFSERFGTSFDKVRTSIFDWLSGQELIVLPFKAGGHEFGYDALFVGPLNAAFFAAALADLQVMIPLDEVPENFNPRAIIYLAPPFRHTHCNGRQVVVHNRLENLHEVFSLNLYPGPSAKKGVYGILLTLGEKEGWITAHSAVVQVVTPYDNILTIMHEGASGGGKSEMLEYAHRDPDGRLRLGRNILTDERLHLTLDRACLLRPVTDDMTLCHPAIQTEDKKLTVVDAENGWFVRVNHITRYGVDPHLERLCIHPKDPLVFLNLDAVPNTTCLIWEHVEDSPGKPCPNPRVILPRQMVPQIVSEPVEVDVRSFGVRTPPCTKEHPSYGILGLLHLLPPSLAWLWRVVSPRGHSNPSITESKGMESEGIGSYWPFATGRRVDQANLLLEQFRKFTGTRYTLIPNQHIGAWKVGFVPQWIAREYLARRGGAVFKPNQLRPARSPLLGNAVFSMELEGVQIPHWFLEVNTQPEVGDAAYDAGAKILFDFFVQELTPYTKESDLDPLGREIIDCCLSGGKVSDFEKLIPTTS